MQKGLIAIKMNIMDTNNEINPEILTLEKQKIHERLMEVTIKLERVLEFLENTKNNCSKSMAEVTAMISRHEEMLHGNGKPGIVTELDRLNQESMRREKITDVNHNHIIALWVSLSLVLFQIMIGFVKKVTAHIFQ